MDITRPATHIKVHRFLVNLDTSHRQNPFNLLRGKPIRQLFKFIYLSSSAKIHLQTKQNSKIQVISSAQNSLKTVPTLPRFSCPLEAENMYFMDTIVWTIPYELYKFPYRCTDFLQKKFKNFSRTACSSQHSMLFVLYLLLSSKL